ncbi:hypothetical protein HY251_20570, partial [bacterium]|nr:hypothetical protein [bacterium]
VIDVLNVPKQAEHQLASYGEPSEQIREYTVAGMGDLLKTKEGQRLMELEDPWSYRDRLTLPKLIVNGTNDRYWTQDALNIYWDDLEGPKWILYVPNSGHGLEDRGRVTASLAAFTRAIASGRGLPALTWKYEKREDGGLTLKLESGAALVEARLFHASSKTTDFRDSSWEYDKMSGEGSSWSATVERPKDGKLAVFGEAVYESNGARFTLSTQIRILSSGAAAPPKKRWF